MNKLNTGHTARYEFCDWLTMGFFQIKDNIRVQLNTLLLKHCTAIFVYQFGNRDAAGDGVILTLTSHSSCPSPIQSSGWNGCDEETQEATAMLKRLTQTLQFYPNWMVLLLIGTNGSQKQM